MNKFFELYKQQNSQLVVALVDDRYFKNQPIAGGQIIGQVAILINDGSWYKGKKVMADAVRVDADTFAALCSQYGTPAAPWFPGPRKESAKKSDTDKKTYALRQALELSQYKEDPEEICTFEGYSWRAADAVRLLKAMNSEFNKPTKKQLTMFAAVDAEPATAADAEPATAADAEPVTAVDAEPVTAVDAEPATAADAEPATAADAEPAPAADAEPRAAVWSDNMDDAIANRTADTCPLPDWAVDGVRCTYTSAEYGPLTGTACRFHWVQLCHCWLCDFSNEKTTIIGAVVDNIEPLTAADDAPAVTDADVLAAADRIKSNYEAMMQQAAADAAPAPRRRRLNIAPRLLRRLRPVRWVAVAFVVCLLSGLLLGMNTSNAAAVDADADDIAAVFELAPVTITAAAVTDAPAAADAVTPSNEKTASDIAAVTDAPAADAVTPSSEKTASDIAAVTDAPAAADADGLTICAGTAWAYTMMIWA